jgi:aminopeptidase N
MICAENANSSRLVVVELQPVNTRPPFPVLPNFVDAPPPLSDCFAMFARYFPRFFALLLAVSTLHTACAEAPFSFEATPGKLPKNIVPRHYDIRLVPDLDEFTTHGTVTVDLEVLKPANEITFNALDLVVTRATLLAQKETALKPTEDTNLQTVTLKLPEVLPPGKSRLVLEFSGKITEQAQGLFYVKYPTPSGKKIMLGTQMEPTDARRMFPGWDEPVFRATYDLTVVVPEKHLGISNMPLEHEKSLGNGLKEVKFARTPPMASYLVVFVSGELEELKGQSEGVQLRVITTEGKKEQGRYALEATKELLRYYDDYFGIKYPLPKLDQIAVPGGFSGAMENWGGITYNESMLLFDPKTSSLQTKQEIFTTVAHEMSHQWFGNLVTMAWWDNLWLNEGFATWMEHKATDHFNRNWQMWLAASAEKSDVMGGDARSTTHPIQTPVATESEANDAFDNITYQKGGAIIRMLENYLGPEVFRRGIHRYLADHSYSNTTTADLWNALETDSGKPIKLIASSWTEQPGLPLVTVRADCINGRQIVSLEQERFRTQLIPKT